MQITIVNATSSVCVCMYIIFNNAINSCEVDCSSACVNPMRPNVDSGASPLRAINYFDKFSFSYFFSVSQSYLCQSINQPREKTDLPRTPKYTQNAIILILLNSHLYKVGFPRDNVVPIQAYAIRMTFTPSNNHTYIHKHTHTHLSAHVILQFAWPFKKKKKTKSYDLLSLHTQVHARTYTNSSKSHII